MIEQRTMFVVETSHNITEILAQFDTEKKEVICYYDINDESWYGRLDGERYFSTRQQAEDYRTNRQAQLRAKFAEVREFVEEMNNIYPENFKFDEKEFFGDCATLGRSSNYNWYKEYKAADKQRDILIFCLRKGYLNINGVSFRPDDVDYIKWYSNKADIYLINSGIIINTADEDEFELIQLIFGRNLSGYSHRERH
jgi:hypothetical protein